MKALRRSGHRPQRPSAKGHTLRVGRLDCLGAYGVKIAAAALHLETYAGAHHRQAATRHAHGEWLRQRASGRAVLAVAAHVKQLLEHGQWRKDVAAVAGDAYRALGINPDDAQAAVSIGDTGGLLRHRVAVGVARPLDIGADGARRNLPVVARAVVAARRKHHLHAVFEV